MLIVVDDFIHPLLRGTDAKIATQVGVHLGPSVQVHLSTCTAKYKMTFSWGSSKLAFNASRPGAILLYALEVAAGSACEVILAHPVTVPWAFDADVSGAELLYVPFAKRTSLVITLSIHSVDRPPVANERDRASVDLLYSTDAQRSTLEVPFNGK